MYKWFSICIYDNLGNAWYSGVTHLKEQNESALSADTLLSLVKMSEKDVETQFHHRYSDLVQ